MSDAQQPPSTNGLGAQASPAAIAGEPRGHPRAMVAWPATGFGKVDEDVLGGRAALFPLKSWLQHPFFTEAELSAQRKVGEGLSPDVT